jgi:hypothetical protein
MEMKTWTDGTLIPLNGEPEDIWLDAPVTSHSAANARFFGVAQATFSCVANSRPNASVKFNLTAYLRHLIEQSKEQS